jgi:hypothetical protein
LGITMFFSCSSSSSILLSFSVATNISLISPQRNEEIPLPIPWGPSQLSLFSHIFSYTPVRPTFYMGIEGDILWYYCSNFFNKSRK